MAFKMKRWGGYQKPSPVNKIDLSGTLSKIQSTISNLFEGGLIKPNKGEGFIRPTIGTGPGQLTESEYIEKYGKLSGFGLTKLEKKQAKKLGMSEYQWKTGVGISHSQRHHKRTFEKKHGLGKYAPEERVDDFGGQYGDYVEGDDESISQFIEEVESDPNANIIKGKPTSTTTVDEGEWVQDKYKSDWWYRKTDKGYQTKKGEDGRVIDVFDEKSKAYKSISEKVFDIYKK